MDAKTARATFVNGEPIIFFRDGYYIGRIVNIKDTSPLTCEVEVLNVHTYPNQYYIQGNKDIFKEAYPLKYKEIVELKPKDMQKHKGEIKDYNISLEESLKLAIIQAMGIVKSIDNGATGFNFNYARQELEVLWKHGEQLSK